MEVGQGDRAGRRSDQFAADPAAVGVGDADDLRRLAIPVVAHLPGVGRGLKDHVAAPVQYRATKDVSVARKLTRLGRYKIALEWLLTKKGLGATNFFEVGAFLRTDDSHPGAQRADRVRAAAR